MTIAQSIFGIEAPKFIKDSTTILLDHIIVLNDNPELEIIRQESIINRHREWVVIGDHWTFEINILLFKFEDDALTIYNTIKDYEYEIVDSLYRRRDGIAFKDADNNDVPFRLDYVHEFYIDRWDYPDLLNLKFSSQERVVIEKSAIDPGS